ncbi:MAG: hypothetical protein KGI00_02340 [Candidatus Micrarchaeota archaeon]|nr:hypothetical protein [Candidatus Micrarchaeota archaeon]MDE1823751.1 hypothetical protein [Candidatus Micrarchaeota archaeon]MDE1849548.1 hypothetical protein [Candidatus Micrarchaeota archaeon]
MGTKTEKRTKKQQSMWPLYVILAILIAAYALYNNVIIGIAAFLMVIATLVMEFSASVRQEGTKKSIIDTVLAIAAVLGFWVVLIIVLQTSSPINVVASCSMLPSMHRGDLVILHGIGSMTRFLDSKGIPTVNVSESQFSSMNSSMSNEFIAFFAYSQSNRSDASQYVNSSSSGYGIGLYNTQCLSANSYLGKPNDNYRCYVPSQQGNLVQYNYTVGRISIGKQLANVIETSAISINGRPISQSYSNPIIVYRTTGHDSFQGDIIHRTYAAMNVNGSYYLLTKGDNNPALDMQFANYPIAQGDVVGYVIADIPYLGYLKLILSGQLGAVPGCDQQILR